MMVKYSGDLNTDLVRCSNGQKEVRSQMFRLVFKCHLNTGQPDHMNTRQLDATLFSHTLIWYLNCQSSA